jgi:hypothetical protein
VIHVFGGPSLPPAGLADGADSAVWHGPAGRDDLAALTLGPGDTVALIDGFVISAYSPSPQECASVLERGAAMWGCSSLGALRAVELGGLGMIGHGWVYERVLERTVTWDDELVAVLDPRDWAARTVFLVNVRYGLTTLGGLTATDTEQVLVELREMPIAERTGGAVRAALVNLGIDAALADAVLGTDCDVKRKDAHEMLSLLLSRERTGTLR